MKTSDLMTQEVISVHPEATLSDAIRLMVENTVSGLPVITTNGSLVGVITESDLLRRAELGTEKRRLRLISILVDPDFLAADYVRAHGRKVSDVMTQNVYTVVEDTPVDEVVAIMEKHNVKRLPVLRGDKVVGIISRADLMKALGSALASVSPTTAKDKQIHRALLKELHDQKWSRRRPHVEVRDGIIDLIWIELANDSERTAARVAAENVPGVKEVREHLVYKG